ncbi:MAG: hypothetical protein JST14_05470 [Bacteroidetes bacterium]|nr:hypothetical protein [Bacteroidota bacterium]
MKPLTIISPLEEGVLKTLSYYDLFDYPLTPTEVFHYLPTNHTTECEVESALKHLEQRCLVFAMNGFYSMRQDPWLGMRRIKGNRMAKEHMRIARNKARLISLFPFTRSVMISGSLSKGYADEESDIDFFVITASGRLWITRMLLVLFKRLFLLNNHKYFCVNYYVSEDQLALDEHNIYTATELATLIPLENSLLHAELLRNNRWLADFFPNLIIPEVKEVTSTQAWFKRGCEFILNLFFPAFFDKSLMGLFHKRMRRIYGRSYQQEDFDRIFKSNPGVSRNHPRDFQKLVVDQYEQKLNQLFSKLHRG